MTAEHGRVTKPEQRTGAPGGLNHNTTNFRGPDSHTKVAFPPWETRTTNAVWVRRQRSRPGQGSHLERQTRPRPGQASCIFGHAQVATATLRAHAARSHRDPPRPRPARETATAILPERENRRRSPSVARPRRLLGRRRGRGREGSRARREAGPDRQWSPRKRRAGKAEIDSASQPMASEPRRACGQWAARPRAVGGLRGRG